MSCPASPRRWRRRAGAGAPLTHRGAAQAVTFVTGHAAAGGEPDLDWASLARPNQTVVIYMGLSTAAAIAARLIGGRPRGLDAGADRRERQPADRAAHRHHAGGPWRGGRGLEGPALLIVGEAMALAQAAHRRLRPSSSRAAAAGCAR